MPAIMYGTRYDNFLNAVESENIPINYAEYRPTVKLNSGTGGTIVSSKTDIPATFKIGDKVTVTTPNGSFTGAITALSSKTIPTSSAYFFLEPGVDYIKGAKITSGSYSHAAVDAPVKSDVPSAPASKVAAAVTSNKAKYLMIGIVVIGAALLVWKYKKKIFKE